MPLDQRPNARLAVVGQNPAARRRTLTVLTNWFAHRSEPPWLSRVGSHAGEVSQTEAEAKDDRRAERRFAVNMERHATGADQEGRQRLHKTPEGMRAGQWWTLWTLNVTLKVQLVMLCCKKNLVVQFVTCSCLFTISKYFNHVKTVRLLRLKSHNFVIFQDN